MTNPLEPNDLSHLSDEEFIALCPQGFHGTGDFEPDNLTPKEHNELVLISEHGIAPPLPTNDELNELWNYCGTADEYGHHSGNIFQFARAVLEKWGQ